MGYLKDICDITGRIQQCREELFKLMLSDPDLPVVPMVDHEIVGDDFGRWLGAWGSSYIGEYLIGEDSVYFREDDDPSEVERLVSEKLGDEAYGAMSDEEAERTYAEMPWIEAIIVNIDLPG